MQLFFTDTKKVWKVGEVAGIPYADFASLLQRRPLRPGTPILLDDWMRPVEPISSWFRAMSLDRASRKTMKAYALTILMLLHFLEDRGSDLLSATETDIIEFRQWRLDDDEHTVDEGSWDRDAAAIGSFYQYLVNRGYLQRRPWRPTPGSASLGSGVSRDPRVRHLELEQYLFLRDVGFGGLTPDASLDEGFGGWWPHRNRATSELALLTGMRIQEWSTLLLPELGLEGGRRPQTAEVDLKECAKFGRPRTVYVPRDAMDLLDPYLLLERPDIVAKAQRVLRRRHRELFVVQRLEADGTKVRGVLEGRTVTRAIKRMPPELRRITVLETGDGLDPLAVFVGHGGRMLTASGWDRVRWRAWDRMKAWSEDAAAPPLPRQVWHYHDLRSTFALRLLIYLTRQALNDVKDQELPMATLLKHMSGNPLLKVQQRLGHARPASTYRYVRYLEDPMPEVEAAFREWTDAGGASYATIALHLMNLEDRADASQG